MNDLVKQDQAMMAIADPERMNSIMRFSELMAQAVVTVPKHLTGKPADCMAVVMQAAQWGMNPYSVAQKTHLVNGVLGYESQLVNAVISSSRAIKGRFKYEYSGDWEKMASSACVRVGAILNGEVDITWGEWLYPSKVTTKNSPLWKTAPKQQAAYLAVKYWARLYCPDVILGVYTPDELEEPQEIDITPPANEDDALNALRQSNEEQAPIQQAQEQEGGEQEQSLVSSEFEALQHAITGTECNQELNAIAGTIAASDTLSEQERSALRKLYGDKLKSFK
jgi:hypothetical protein